MSDLRSILKEEYAKKAQEPVLITPSMLMEMMEDLSFSPDSGQKRNIDLAIDIIKGEGYDYELLKKNVIRVKDDQRVQTMEKLASMLSPLGFSHNPTAPGSAIGRIEILDKDFGSVYIYVKPKSRTSAATAGMDFEEKLANIINNEYGNLGITASTAGFGAGSDLTIASQQLVVPLTIELKTALSADFGQFRAQYDMESKSWSPRQTKGFVKNKEIFGPLFDVYLKNTLDETCVFADLGDPRLRVDDGTEYISGLQRSSTTGELKKELQNSWFNGKTDLKVEFPFEKIANYYTDKGDRFIQIGTAGLYALTDEASELFGIPKFADSGLTSFLRFRLKPAMGANGSTSFTVAVKLKGRLKKSNLSLLRREDLNKIINSIIE